MKPTLTAIDEDLPHNDLIWALTAKQQYMVRHVIALQYHHRIDLNLLPLIPMLILINKRCLCLQFA